MMMNEDDMAIGTPDHWSSFNPQTQVRAYWEGLRDNDAIPKRSQINPRGLEQALSSTFLIERVAPGMARFRIAGMDFADVVGMEVRGLPISSIFSPVARPDLTLKLEQVFAKPAVLTLDLVAPAGLGRPTLTAQLLVMPLRGNTGRIDLALGCIALTGTIGRTPRRFEIAKAAVEVLTVQNKPAPHRAAAKPFAPKVVTAQEQQVFAEAAERFNAPRKDKTHAHLRVVK